MAIHAIRLPVDIEQGAQGGPGFYTTIIASPSGAEQRNLNWAEVRGEWDIGYMQRRDEYQSTITAFFLARRGMAHSFLFKDWSDYKVFAGFQMTGDGAETDFQLIKRYADTVDPFDREIYRPLISSLVIFVDGTPLTVDDWAHLGHGVISLDVAPGVGEVVTATFEFDVPVRFGVDRLDKLYTLNPGVYAIPSLKLVEVRAPDY